MSTFSHYTLEQLENLLEKEEKQEVKYQIILEIAEKLDEMDDTEIEEINNSRVEVEQSLYNELGLISLEEMEHIPLEELIELKLFNNAREEGDTHMTDIIPVPKQEESSSVNDETNPMHARFNRAHMEETPRNFDHRRRAGGNYSFLNRGNPNVRGTPNIGNFVPRQETTLREVSLKPISNTGYILDIDCATNAN